MKLVIYSSWLDSVKSLASLYCGLVCNRHREYTLPKKLRRYDALSRGLGYKSHSDLVVQSSCNAESYSANSVSFYSAVKDYYHPIAEALAPLFGGLSTKQILECISAPAPKDTEFRVVNGCPVVRWSPLDPDIDNSLRSPEELSSWWNVPFIHEYYAGQETQYTVACLDGGCWDRATQKAWPANLAEALQSVSELKQSNPNYRDYGTEANNYFTIDVKYADDQYTPQYIAKRIFINAMASTMTGYELHRSPYLKVRLISESKLSLSKLEDISHKVLGLRLGEEQYRPALDCTITEEHDLLVEVDPDVVPYWYLASMIQL
ncbi:hypothetical protein L1D14_03825 [Vibrio tubiashii]|uniref:hypothetical protein n=1 Tax=Vibrio tubiashii TaxID=29498 RepID=UPI001EFCFB39|nr:hypothetical protein [Vibrio tubiashii]MCG9575359.1 hypothetical protein [Vibrio tubiashii]